MDMHEEIRNGYTVTAQMKRVWAIQMDMAKKLIEVCDRNGLKVWAASGTLLGCVRDRGFIPWDDDIEMVMLRDDYDKLVSIADILNVGLHQILCRSAENIRRSAAFCHERIIKIGT